jgi:hypothetical protein
MWVERIILENIKCFRHEDIIFSQNRRSLPGRAQPCSWITLLGENGVGKSTILQALGLLLAGPEAAKELLPRPSGWVRDPNSPGKLTIVLHKEEGDEGTFGEDKIRNMFRYSMSVTGSEPVQVGTQVYTEPALIEIPGRALSWLRTNAFKSGNRGWFAVGYGAFRRLTRLNQVLVPSLDPPKRSSNFTTQFNEDTPLSSFERWMVYLDYRLAKDNADLKARHMKSVGEQAIINLLPGDVRIQGVTKDGLIQFLVDGQAVPTVGLSDGFRSVIALAGDLIWRLLQSFPELDDPTEASGVVLIDELDIHLHPTWQREIAGWLQTVFPRIQFFVATHSPLVAAGAGLDALTLRLNMLDGVMHIEEISNDVLAADVDRTLRSPAFGLHSTFSPPTERNIKRYHDLGRRKGRLDEAERQEFKQLQMFMRDVQPFGERPDPDSLEARIDALLQERLS